MSSTTSQQHKIPPVSPDLDDISELIRNYKKHFEKEFHTAEGV